MAYYTSIVTLLHHYRGITKYCPAVHYTESNVVISNLPSDVRLKCSREKLGSVPVCPSFILAPSGTNVAKFETNIKANDFSTVRSSYMHDNRLHAWKTYI